MFFLYNSKNLQHLKTNISNFIVNLFVFNL